MSRTAKSAKSAKMSPRLKVEYMLHDMGFRFADITLASSLPENLRGEMESWTAEVIKEDEFGGLQKFTVSSPHKIRDCARAGIKLEKPVQANHVCADFVCYLKTTKESGKR